MWHWQRFSLSTRRRECYIETERKASSGTFFFGGGVCGNLGMMSLSHTLGSASAPKNTSGRLSFSPLSVSYSFITTQLKRRLRRGKERGGENESRQKSRIRRIIRQTEPSRGGRRHQHSIHERARAPSLPRRRRLLLNGLSPFKKNTRRDSPSRW